MNMFNLKLEACHADTCLADYWSGHHLPHVQIPVYNGMTLKAIKDSIKSELNEGAVMGSDYELIQSEQFYKAARAAVNRMRPNVKGQRTFFKDLEPVDNESDDCGDSVYAFFVFRELAA